jgi:hypothetical protein
VAASPEPTTPATTSLVSPAPSKAKPIAKPIAKPVLVPLRLTPFAGEREVRIGKRTWRVDKTIDDMIASGRYKVALRSLGGSEWNALPPVVIEPGFSYILRVNSNSVIVSRSETAKRPP